VYESAACPDLKCEHSFPPTAPSGRLSQATLPAVCDPLRPLCCVPHRQARTNPAHPPPAARISMASPSTASHRYSPSAAPNAYSPGPVALPASWSGASSATALSAAPPPVQAQQRVGTGGSGSGSDSGSLISNPNDVGGENCGRPQWWCSSRQLGACRVPGCLDRPRSAYGKVRGKTEAGAGLAGVMAGRRAGGSGPCPATGPASALHMCACAAI